jgi:hypothetical protein
MDDVDCVEEGGVSAVVVVASGAVGVIVGDGVGATVETWAVAERCMHEGHMATYVGSSTVSFDTEKEYTSPTKP